MVKDTAHGTTEILCEVRISATDEEVMRAILTPDALACWMQARIDFRAERDQPFRLEWEDPAFPASVSGQILDLNPNRWILLSWKQSGRDLVTQVNLGVTPGEQGTLVRLRHSGFPAGPEWTGIRDLVRADWEKSLTNLRFFIEEGGLSAPPLLIRRTVAVGTPPERAYQVWSQEGHLVAWWLREARLDPLEGGSLRFAFHDGATITGKVLLLQKHRHMRWLWVENESRTMVGVSFWPLTIGSRVTVTQLGFRLADEVVRREEARWDRCFEELIRYTG